MFQGADSGHDSGITKTKDTKGAEGMQAYRVALKGRPWNTIDSYALREAGRYSRGFIACDGYWTLDKDRAALFSMREVRWADSVMGRPAGTLEAVTVTPDELGQY
jgi:hypothetical protein